MNSVRKHFAPALRKVPGIVVGVFDADRLEVTALGTLEREPDPASLCWEIGSITKVFTGILLAEMSIRGEVGLNDPIGLHLPDPVADRLPAAGLQPTLADLATHSAGFPRLPPSILRLAKGSEDPYSNLTEDNVLAYLGPKARRPRRRRSRYSNYGMGLLGQMLAGVAATPYATLIEQRLLDPLGMTTTGIGTCGEETKPVQGFRKGTPTPPRTFGALEGTGALRSTVNDLMRFVRACLDPPDGPSGMRSIWLAARSMNTACRSATQVWVGCSVPSIGAEGEPKRSGMTAVRSGHLASSPLMCPRPEPSSLLATPDRESFRPWTARPGRSSTASAARPAIRRIGVVERNER